MELITKNSLKQLLQLGKKKFRAEQGRMFIEGFRLLDEALKCNLIVEEILISESRLRKLHDTMPAAYTKYICTLVTDDDFARLAETESPQGIGAVVRIPKTPHAIQAINSKTVLYLDRISDPGNLGTIFRTAQWFGVSDIIVSEDCADEYNPKVVRSSLGAVFSENIYHDPAAKAVNLLREKGYMIASAHLQGEKLQEFKRDNTPVVIIIGSEAHGVAPELLALSDKQLVIPGTGAGESLNAAVSAGIFLALLTGN